MLPAIRQVATILRIYEGLTADHNTCAPIAAALGSREELLAWLLLQRGVASALPGLGQSLVDAARKCSTRAETRRSEGSEPLEQRLNYAALDASLRALVDAHFSLDSKAHAVTQDLAGFAYFRQSGASLGHALRIRN